MRMNNTARTCPARPKTPSDRTRHHLAALVATLTLSAACDDDQGFAAEDPESPEPTAQLPATDAALATALEPAELLDFPVCPAHRVIAVRTTSGACDAELVGSSGKWVGTSLFAEFLDEGEVLPGALGRLCEFQWSSPSPGAEPELSLFDEKPYTGVESDCEVVWPQGEQLDPLRAPLRDAFYTHLGRLDLLPVAPRSSVTVALADTASSANVVMNSDHALNMARIIQSIACPAGLQSCPVDIARHLALPLLAPGEIDPVHGGFRGSKGHLARAIFSAVKTWKQAQNGSPMAINLSLGWRADLFGGLEDPLAMSGPVRAVFRTAQFAVCNRALLVVAAGNTAGDDCQEGPLAPAVWEDVMGPDPAICAQLFGAANVDPPADIASQPLVHAVGGVAYDNAPLQNSLPGARPRLAAPGFMASTDSPTGLTLPLTGSSAAAAAVTGIAALVWSYHPTLSPGQVMARIYNGGAPLGPTADFGLGGEIHRASVCEALAENCVKATCPADCPDTTVDTVALAAATDDVVTNIAGTDIEAPYQPLGVDSCDAMCSASCAPKKVAGHNRYTKPQPDWPTCSVCFLSRDEYTVYAELDTDYTNIVGVEAVLLEVSDGTSSQRHALGAPATLTSGSLTPIVLDPTLLPASVARATLHITYVNEAGESETRSNAISVY